MQTESLVVRRVLLQFGVFGFGLEEDGEVGVGVFPEGEEVLVGGAGFGGVVGEDGGTGDAEVGEGVDDVAVSQSGGVEDSLELSLSLGGVFSLEVGQAANVHAV